MTYTLFNQEGTPIAGDSVLGQPMKDLCDEVKGHIENDTTHQTVYPEEG